MSCHRPITAYRTAYVNPETGKRGITFTRNNGYTDKKVQVPCGKCLACQNKRVNQWALRCTHEAQFHEKNCFITLTYDDDHLPSDGSLHHEHFQKFMKRLRKKYSDKKIRYFMCGEYGGLTQRPHYHALLFGIDFPDQQLHSTTGKVKNYTSDTLSKLWPFGYHTIGSVHYGTARYTAKYSLKQLQEIGIDYGHRKPEYRKMSQGIGADYAKKYADELELHDSIIYNSYANSVPSYYEKYMSSDGLQKLKDKRIATMINKTRLFETDHRIREKIAVKKRKLFNA